MNRFRQTALVLVATLHAAACARTTPNDRTPDAAVSPPKAAASGFPSLPPDREAHAPPAPPDPALPAPAPTGSPSAACMDCHPDETDGFHATGMGRALYRPQSQPPVEDFAHATVRNGALEYRAYIDADGRWWQEETVPGTEHRRRVEVTHVIGSGNHTRSYLGLVEGEVVELPLTWYVRRGIWDMSPGYEGGGNQRFSRPVKPDCLFCHNDFTPARADSRSGYTAPLAEGISCGRCHGDGSAHVTARQGGTGAPAGQPDPTILNPRRLDPAGQLQVCQQCHLQGEVRVLREGKRWDAYNPRDNLADYLSIFVYADDRGTDFSIASHGHRLSLSACSKAPAGLPCTTCHNPHRKDDRAQQAACLGCHQVEQCGEAHKAGQDQTCAHCHMRQGGTSDIPHVTFTDHYIRKRPEVAPPLPEEQLELVDALAAGRTTPDTPAQAQLHLGVAHAELWRYEGLARHLPEARTRLEAAMAQLPEAAEGWLWLARVRRATGDLPGARQAWARLETLRPKEALFRPEQAEVLEMMGDLAGAEATLRTAIALDPNARVALGNLANVLQRQERHTEAEALYARADALAPEEAITATNRAFNFMQLKRPADAERSFREAIRRDATSPRGAFGLGLLAVDAQHPEEARRHFDAALQIAPDFADGWWLRGRLALQQGDLAAARSDLDRLLALVPQHVGGYLDRAEVEAKAGNRAAREAILLQGLQALPDHPALREALNGGPR